MTAGLCNASHPQALFRREPDETRTSLLDTQVIFLVNFRGAFDPTVIVWSLIRSCLADFPKIHRSRGQR